MVGYSKIVPVTYLLMIDLSTIVAVERFEGTNDHLRFMQSSNAAKKTELKESDNTIAWLMFIGLFFAVWQILFCLYKKNEAYRARLEKEKAVIKSSLPVPDIEAGVEKKEPVAAAIEKKVDYQELDVETQNTNMSISESYEFEQQLTNRLGRTNIKNEEEIQAELQVKKLQDEILRETAMVKKEQEKKEENEQLEESVQIEGLNDQNPDQLVFNSDVEIEETSDEGEPGVFNYDNMAEQFQNQGVPDLDALKQKQDFGSFVSNGTESGYIEAQRSARKSARKMDDSVSGSNLDDQPTLDGTPSPVKPNEITASV